MQTWYSPRSFGTAEKIRKATRKGTIMVRVNRWAFVAFILCFVLFLCACAGPVKSFIIQEIGVNPWFMVLIGSIVTLPFGVLGLAGAHHFFARFRSIMTLIITLALSAFRIAVISLGNIFRFT